MRRVLLGLVVGLGMAAAAPPAKAQVANWADALFRESSHDFGTVARGTKLRYTFWLVNTSSTEVHILGQPRPKCGCTDVKIGAREIPPGTQSPIEATLDTTRFQGRKDSGLYLQLSANGMVVEKELNLNCFIRTDVTLAPGMADFGTVARGSTPEVVTVLSYGGGVPGWKITGATTISDQLEADVSAPVALAGGGVQYQITTHLKPSAAAGFFKDEINLITNDPSTKSIPISVVANIQAVVSVSPGNLVMGRVKAGQTIQKTVLVRSAKPFKITGTASPKAELTAAKVNDATGTVQQMTVTLKAPMTPGPFNAILEISTDLKDEPPARMTAFATVVP